MTKKQKSQHKMGSNNKNTQSILKETDLSSTQCVCSLLAYFHVVRDAESLYNHE